MDPKARGQCVLSLGLQLVVSVTALCHVGIGMKNTLRLLERNLEDVNFRSA